MKLEKNIGSTDRIVRFVLAALFAVLYFTGIVSAQFTLLSSCQQPVSSLLEHTKNSRLRKQREFFVYLS
jgi:hypothetical protein